MRKGPPRTACPGRQSECPPSMTLTPMLAARRTVVPLPVVASINRRRKRKTPPSVQCAGQPDGFLTTVKPATESHPLRVFSDSGLTDETMTLNSESADLPAPAAHNAVAQRLDAMISPIDDRLYNDCLRFGLVHANRFRDDDVLRPIVDQAAVRYRK